MKHFFTAFAFMAWNAVSAQAWRAELMTGIAGYGGDLNQSIVQFQSLGPAAQFNLKYNLNETVMLRAGLGWGIIGGNDKHNNDPALFQRNLSFKSHIVEANLCLELNLLPPEVFDIVYPYAFAGVGIFHFNPYAKDNNGQKVFLQPLSTEGEGLPEYPDRKPYKLTQFCIPFGGGVNYNLSDRLQLSGEIGFRKIFTDYLDDVSTTYPDYNVLIKNRGLKAMEMSYRGTYVNSNYEPTPPQGTIRGNSKKKDWYYFAGLKLSVRLGSIE